VGSGLKFGQNVRMSALTPEITLRRRIAVSTSIDAEKISSPSIP
jgi:hypothetical protein